MSFDFYSAYFISLVTLAVIVFIFIYDLRAKLEDKGLFRSDFNFLGLSCLMAIFALILFAPFLIPILKGIFFSPKVGILRKNILSL